MDLSTEYLGIKLPHPLIPGASPMCDNVDSVRRLEDHDAPMVVLRSLFEEQIVSEQLAGYFATETLAESFGEASTFLAEPDDLVFGPHEYLEHLRSVREAVSIPVVASLNGTTRGGWLEYASLIQEAGANALELNIYELATRPGVDGASIERESLEMVRQVKAKLSIPVAVKLSPFYTSFAHFAEQIWESGADALVLFNRFYQPDIDIEALETVPTLHLSDSSELLLRLRWLAILSGQLEIPLALTGGAHEPEDAIKALMCGACVVQLVSTLLKNGPKQLPLLRDEIARWLEEHEYESLQQMIGCMNLRHSPDPQGFERANYMHILQSWEPYMAR